LVLDLLADAIIASAEKNSKVKYAIVDHDGLKNFCCKVPNVKGLTFKTNENSFVAGYMAAGLSKTGKVATYGGMPFPTVTIFMDGYAKGVEFYNEIKGKSVKVLGWDPLIQDLVQWLATSLIQLKLFQCHKHLNYRVQM